jgi:hypothetical protein
METLLSVPPQDRCQILPSENRVVLGRRAMVSVTCTPQRGTAAPDRTAWTLGNSLSTLLFDSGTSVAFPDVGSIGRDTHGRK